jgi:hypothetical protein
VCSGGQLELICTIAGELLQWRFSVIRGDSEVTRTITSTGSAISPLTVNSMMFNFSRISPHNSMPLMSRLVISPVSNSLNGTVMNCVDLDTGEVASTTIIVGESGTLQGMNYSCHSQGTAMIDGHVQLYLSDQGFPTHYNAILHVS